MPEQEAWSSWTRPHRGVHREEQGPTSGRGLVSICISERIRCRGNAGGGQHRSHHPPVCARWRRYSTVLVMAPYSDSEKLVISPIKFDAMSSNLNAPLVAEYSIEAQPELLDVFRHTSVTMFHMTLPPVFLLEPSWPAFTYRTERTYGRRLVFNPAPALRSIAIRNSWLRRAEAGVPIY